MAATSNLTDISACDSLTNWAVTGGPTMVLDADFKIEGSYSIGGDVDVETGKYLYDYYTANGNTALDMSNKHLYIWALCLTASFLDSKANGGIQLVLQDGSGNEGYWYVAGYDTYIGGWRRFIIDGNSTPTANNGTNPTASNIYYVGIIFKGLTKSKLAENCFFDLVQYGLSTTAALSITGGTSGTPLTWADVLSGDQGLSKQVGAIREESGVYYLQAPIEFGDSGGTGDMYFADTNQIIVWEDTLASTSFYKFSITGNGTGTTSFVLGTVSGSGINRFGSGGGVITAAGAHKWTIDAETDYTDIDECFLYGVNMLNSGILQFRDNTNTQKIIGCTFDTCLQLQPNEAEILRCNFLNSIDTSGAVEMLDNDDDNITYCLFRNCDNGVYFPSGETATRDFVGLDFDDVVGNYDVNNNSGSTVTANQTADSNANSYNPANNVVTFVNTKTLTIRNLVIGSRVTVEKVSDASVIWAPFIADTSTEQKTDYNYVGDIDVYIKVRYSSASTKYLPLKQQATITSTGMDVTVVQIIDTNAT